MSRKNPIRNESGPQEKFAPLYSFVHQNAALFDDYETYPDVVVAYAQRTFDRDRAKFVNVCHRLAAANISFRLALGGDDVVEHSLSPAELRAAPRVLVLEPGDFQKKDRETLDSVEVVRRLNSVEDALKDVKPAARVATEGELRVLPRVKAGSALIHVVNWKYEPDRDTVQPAKDVRLTLDLKALGVPGAKTARVLTPQKGAASVSIADGTLVVPEVGLWSVVEVKAE